VGLLMEHTLPTATGTISLQSGTNPVVQNGNLTTHTISRTVAAGTDRLMLVCLTSEGNAGGTLTASSVTYGGTNLSLLQRATPANWSVASMWWMVAPPVGTANVVVTFPSQQSCDVAIYVFDGVNQTEPFRNPILNFGTSAVASTVTLQGVGSNDLVVDALTIDSNPHSASPNAGQTQQYNLEVLAGSHTGAGSTEPGSSGGIVGWTWTTLAPFSHVVAALIPNVAAGGPVAMPLSLALTLNPSLVRLVNRNQSFALTLSPVVSRRIDRNVSLALTMAASLSRRINRTLALALTLTPSVVLARILTRAVSLALTLAPSVTRRVDRKASLALTLSPTVNRLVKRTLSITPSFGVSVLRRVDRALSFAPTFNPSVSRSIDRKLSNSLSFNVSTLASKVTGPVTDIAISLALPLAVSISLGWSGAVATAQAVKKWMLSRPWWS
jgi:hypothetical protein